jgi:trehalose 6-phosphate synthase/phosphatase
VKYYKRATKKLFFFDYENTLQPIDENICSQPNHSKEEKLTFLKPEKRLIKLIKILSEEKGNQIYILSKYETDYLSQYFGNIPNIGLCCENGFYYKRPNDKEFNDLVEVNDWSWKDTVIKILKTFTEKTEGSFIIEKKSSLIWNYNNSDETFGPLQSDEIKTHITSIFNAKILDISNLDGILEIKPKNVNKGYFVAKILQEQFKEQNIDLIFAVGDDLSDENMFNYFRSAEKYFRNFNTKIKTFTATINKKTSNAKYFFNDINDFIEALDALSHQNFVKEFKKDNEEIKEAINRSFKKKLSVNLNQTMFKFRTDKKFKEGE